MTCQCSALPARFRRRVDRRALLKASAAFGAMAALGGTIPRLGRAQEDAGTLAATWLEPQNAGSLAAASDARLLPTDFTFFAVAPHWSGAVDFPGLVEMSFSTDGEAWSDALTVGEALSDAGQPDRDGRRFGQLALIDGANFIQYRTFDDGGNPTSLADLAFTYIDATGGPSIDDVFSAAVSPSIDRPPIISREMWGADDRYRHEDQDSSEPIIWTPRYQTVEHVIVHHTVTPNFQDPLTAIRSIYYYHAVTRGWGDIGYNFLVDFMGNVYEGRYGGDDVIGGHAYEYAQGSSGIGTIGNFSNDSETPEAQAGLIWITAWVGRDLDPWGTSNFHDSRDLPTICAHRDVDDTDCPGDVLYSDLDWIRSSVAAILEGQVDPEPDPVFTEGDVVSVATDGANLRSGPGLDYRVITIAPFGTLFQVIDGPTTNSDHTWYRLTGDAGTGWCAEELLAMSNDAPPPPQPSQFVIGDQVVVDTDALNLRDGPGLDYAVVTTIPNGTTGDVEDGPSAANGYNWFLIGTSLGTGWGVDAYLSLADRSREGPFAIGDDVVVDTDALNLRSGPGTNEPVVAVMPTGARLSIVGGPRESSGYLWYEASSRSYGDGWCVADYLAPAGGSSGGSGRFEVGDAVVVDTDALNMRSGPGTDNDVLAVLLTGEGLTISDGPRSANGYTWYAVSSDDFGDGWCVEDFLAPSIGGSTGFENGDRVFVDTDALNLRSEPDPSGEVRATMPTGARLEITGSSRTAGGFTWYPVENDRFGAGWSAGDYLKLVTEGSGNGIAVGSTVRVIEGALNLRSSPNIEADVLAVLPDGHRAQVTDGPRVSDSRSWYEVRSATYGDGWCAAEFLQPD